MRRRPCALITSEYRQHRRANDVLRPRDLEPCASTEVSAASKPLAPAVSFLALQVMVGCQRRSLAAGPLLLTLASLPPLCRPQAASWPAHSAEPARALARSVAASQPGRV